METKLGKIEHVSFGIGGYQDAMLGIHITLSGSGWGVSTEKSAWDTSVECSALAKWSESDRSSQYDNIMRYVSGLLRDAKVSSVDKLVGIPVKAEFDGITLHAWRVLTEVL